MKFIKILAFVLCACMLLGLCACNKNDGVNDNGSQSADTNTDESKADESKPLTPEEIKRAENAMYLKTVEYCDFELTDSVEPYFVGRWFDKEIDGETHKVTLTDGSAFYFLINGASSFDLEFTVITTLEEPYFAYSIDGKEPIRQHITDKTVTLPDSGRHTVRIIADGMTESEGKWEEEKGFALKCVTPAEGGEIFGIKPMNKVIFYYGDSITEGIRALSMDANSNGNSATNSYAWYCSETLGATMYSVGYGASGVTKEGSFNTLAKAIDYLSKGREVNDGVTPDVIVVNHGTNDSAADARIFNGRLKTAITRLQEKYPNTPIVYMIPFKQTHAEDIKTVMAQFENVYVVETADWGITFTDNGYHPNVAGAKKAGEKLAAALRSCLGESYFD